VIPYDPNSDTSGTAPMSHPWSFWTNSMGGSTCYVTNQTQQVVVLRGPAAATRLPPALERLEKEERRSLVSIQNKVSFWEFVDHVCQRNWGKAPKRHPPTKPYGTSNGIRPVVMLC